MKILSSTPQEVPETNILTPNSPSDEELMVRIQARDEQAFEILIKRFRALLQCIAGKRLSNDQDASDVVSDVLLGIWNHASAFDPSKGTVIAWIATMGTRRAIDRVRRRHTYDKGEMRFRLFVETEAGPFARDDVQREAVNSDVAAMLQKFISAIPSTQSAAVRMAFYGGLSQREIASETGIPLGTIKTRIELGVKKIREAVAAFGSREDWLGGPSRIALGVR